VRLKAGFVLSIGLLATATGLVWVGWWIAAGRDRPGTLAIVIVLTVWLTATGVLVIQVARRSLTGRDRAEPATSALSRGDAVLLLPGLVAIGVGLLARFAFDDAHQEGLIVIGVISLVAWTPRLIGHRLRDP
jgi:hypothetical protein